MDDDDQQPQAASAPAAPADAAPGPHLCHGAAWREQIEARLSDGASVMDKLRTELADNTASTKEIQANTGDLVSLMQSLQGAFRVIEMLGRVMRPIGWIAAGVASVWALVVAVRPPK